MHHINLTVNTPLSIRIFAKNNGSKLSESMSYWALQ